MPVKISHPHANEAAPTISSGESDEPLPIVFNETVEIRETAPEIPPNVYSLIYGNMINDHFGEQWAETGDRSGWRRWRAAEAADDPPPVRVPTTPSIPAADVASTNGAILHNAIDETVEAHADPDPVTSDTISSPAGELAFARLDFSAATASSATAATTAWPPPTHDELLQQAFPGLSKYELHAMQSGSRDVDAKLGLLPITLLEGNAPQHAMTPGIKVREYQAKGLSRAEAVKAAQEWARQETARFIEEKKKEAKAWLAKSNKATDPLFKRDCYEAALFSFGQAMHPVMDNMSPAHRDYQVYDTALYKALIAVDPQLGVSAFAADMMVHKETESRPPTPEERAAMNAEMYKHYRDVFGEADLLRAKPKN